jgi:hypothetical protein
VILDACRNNPFAKRFTLASQGLAQVDAPPGTLIAFSTAPGSVAADGTGRNGLYTRHLLEQMKKPGAQIEETFKSVRAAVRKESAGRQIPWESTSLETQFAFYAAAPAKPATPQKVAKGPSPPPSADTGRTRSVPPSAPPVLATGDTWTYRVRDLLSQSERSRTMSIKEIKGSEVFWRDGAKSDLLGNFTRSKLNDIWRTYTPSTQLYVFPLNPGARFTLKGLEEYEDRTRTYDHDITFTVVGEEDVTTPAGTFRAVKLVRTLKWTQRGKPENSGQNTITYWYSALAKRWVLQEQVHSAKSGKETGRQRWELESYSVK